MKILKLITVWGVCTILFLGSSCQLQTAEELPPPNIVWIVSEDNSKHYLKLFDKNGIETPNIAALAAQGIQFNRVFSNGAVCSVARSAIISGCYGPRTGTQFHRKLKQVPMPDSLMMFPFYLRKAGYYTANNAKEDYNFIKGNGVWDESSKQAHYGNRTEGQPFMYVHNIETTHESRLHFTEEDRQTPTTTDANSFEVQPKHPNTELFKYTNAYYRDKIQEMDTEVGEVVNALKEDGLLDNTFIFYYGDHGGVLPGSKGYLYETGLHVPMVVYVPEKYKHLAPLPKGSATNGFVSFIDLAPTVLHLVGIEVPEQMDGKPFLGEGISEQTLTLRDEAYGYADRFDEKYDQVRSVRKGRYKYIRNYQPFNFDGLMNNYRYRQLAYQEWKSLYLEGALNEAQSAFFEPRPAEQLFDIESDPFETNNLAGDPQYEDTLQSLRNKLNNWVTAMPDLSFYPEHYLVAHAFDNPVSFGKQHQAAIMRYRDLADLSLQSFEQAEGRLKESLKSSDPWERYWALIVCSSFGEAAREVVPMARSIASEDTELINRVRAAEFMGIIRAENPVKVMTQALYASEDPVESLLIFNSIALMGSPDHGYDFDLQLEKIPEKVREDSEVSRRVEYMTAL